MTACGSGINEYVARMKPIPSVPDEIAIGATRDSSVGGEIWKLTPVKESRSTQELVLFSPFTGVLWPGALIQGATLASGVLGDLGLPRNPITVFVEGAWASDPIAESMRMAPTEMSPNRVTYFGERLPRSRSILASRASSVIAKPDAAKVEEARVAMVGGLTGIPAIFDFSDRQVWSVEQALFTANASASWPSGSLKASLSSESYKSHTNIVVTLTQRYYTYGLSQRFDPPASAFASGVSLKDVQRSSDTISNPLTFVRSVTYGKMAILTVSSSESYDRLRASLQASLSATFGSGSTDINQQQYKAFKESTTKLWVNGGPFPSDTAVVLTGQKIDELRKFLGVGGDTDLLTGVPISFRIDYLNTGMPAKLGLTTEYERVDRALAPQLLEPSIGFAIGNDDKKRKHQCVHATAQHRFWEGSGAGNCQGWTLGRWYPARALWSDGEQYNP